MDDIKIRIVACGHCCIKSTKSGAYFPAYLVCLPDGNNILQSRWRSKRDFLLLKHAYERSNEKEGQKKLSVYPKSALAKLCERASTSGPWIRPEDTLLFRKLQESNNVTTNSYSNVMKKAIQAVDEYLQDMYRVYCCSQQQTEKNHTSAWDIFCRPQDTDVVSCSTATQLRISPLDAAVTASALGQYFASPENIEYVSHPPFRQIMYHMLSYRIDLHTLFVNFGLFCLRLEYTKIIHRLVQTLNLMSLCKKDCIFVEPSCGDGRILSKIFSSLAEERHKSCNQQIICVGYDIDQTAVQASRELLAKYNDCFPPPVVVCRDFLTTTYQEVIQDANNSCNNNRTKHVVVVGGPPYTEARSRGDLAKQFILHSLLRLDASVVIFILPKRCEKAAREIHEELIRRSLLQTNDVFLGTTNNINGLGQNLNSRTWSYMSETLPNSNFDFQSQSVKQPSILQIWTCT